MAAMAGGAVHTCALLDGGELLIRLAHEAPHLAGDGLGGLVVFFPFAGHVAVGAFNTELGGIGHAHDGEEATGWGVLQDLDVFEDFGGR